MSAPKVSVIIPAYNAQLTIERTLDSVFNQTYSALEVIVVNDGSTDQTLNILENYGDRINLISTVNKGVSHARNLGLKHASGDYIQYLDSDDLLMPAKIQQQVDALLTNDADIAYGNWQKFTEVNGEILIKETIVKQLKDNVEIEIFADFWCPPANLLYSKRIVKKIGDWKEWLPVIQDARYMLDAALNHGKFVYSPFLVAQYRIGQENSLSSRNNLNFVKDCYFNAIDVWNIWKNDKEDITFKKEAIITCLRYCVNEFSKLDNQLFHQAVNSILQIEPKYIPNRFGILQVLSKLFGYRNAEKIASLKRKLKQRLN